MLDFRLQYRTGICNSVRFHSFSPKNAIISAMEKIAIDIYTFEKLRKNGFTYVDKTDELYAMASTSIQKSVRLLSIW